MPNALAAPWVTLEVKDVSLLFCSDLGRPDLGILSWSNFLTNIFYWCIKNIDEEVHGKIWVFCPYGAEVHYTLVCGCAHQPWSSSNLLIPEFLLWSLIYSPNSFPGIKGCACKSQPSNLLILLVTRPILRESRAPECHLISIHAGGLKGLLMKNMSHSYHLGNSKVLAYVSGPGEKEQMCFLLYHKYISEVGNT